MKQLYVIVHEWCIKLEPDRVHRLIDNALIKFNLAKIKMFHKYLAINNAPWKLHPDMPEPSNNLEVLVCGAYTQACVQAQLEALQEKGYNARIYEPGCLSGFGNQSKGKK